MSEYWLREELTRHLTPAMAPEELGLRLGFAPAKRREFPRIAMALAAAVVMMMAGGLAAIRTNGGDPRETAAQKARNTGTLEFTSSDAGAVSVWLGHAAGPVRPAWAPAAVRRAGVNSVAVKFRSGSEGATVLVARAGTSAGFGGGQTGRSKRNASLSFSSPDAGCGLCHS